MSTTLANFIFETVNFLLLAAALGWVLYKPVRHALDAEQERRDRDEQERSRLLLEAQTAAREAQSTREAAARESTERREEVLASARREAEQLLEQAKQARAAERRSFESELASARAAQALEWADLIGRIASVSVSRLLETIRGPALDSGLVHAACAELARLEDRGGALVESASPLEATDRARLAALLPGGFEDRTAPELIAGVRVTTSGGQVDASVAAIARQAARTLTNALAEPSARDAHG